MRLSPRSQISGASRRRLARWLVGSPIKDIERDLVLETLAKTDGNRTASARLLGFSIKTCCVIRLRNIQRTALMCHHPAA
jgi:DNA-binding NtrC family response regulator